MRVTCKWHYIRAAHRFSFFQNREGELRAQPGVDWQPIISGRLIKLNLINAFLVYVRLGAVDAAEVKSTGRWAAKVGAGI
jgi:hypothetical protein